MKRQPQAIIPTERPSMKLQAQPSFRPERGDFILPHSLPANGSACAVEESLFDVCKPAIIQSAPLQLLAVDRKLCKEPEITQCP
jgi:hypothetical protein